MTQNKSMYGSKFRNQTMEQKHNVQAWLPEAEIYIERDPYTDEYCLRINLGVHQGVAAKERKDRFIDFINKKLIKEKL